MTHLFASVLLLSAAALPQEPPVARHVDATAPSVRRTAAVGSVRGRVMSERTRQPIESAVVQVVGLPHIVAVTDSTGTYLLDEIPPGLRMVRARGVDHLPLEVEVTVVPRGTMVLEFALELSPVPLPPITVVQRRLTTRDTVPNPRGSLSPGQANLLASAVETLGSSPGVAELGLADAIRSAHGPEPPDASDILYVRGATADLKAVYLDGAPVYAPVHLGGLTEAFHPGLLASGSIFTGGASARYDGGLSYVLDLRSRPGRGGPVRTEGALDLTAGRALAEGSLSTHANFLLGGRVVHGLGSELWTGDEAPSAYREFVARMDGAAGSARQISATFFWNEERVNLADDVPGAGPVHWGNTAGSIRLYSDIPDGEAQIGASFGSFRTRLPVVGSELTVIEGQSLRRRAFADLRHDRGRFRLDYGLSFERMLLEHMALSVARQERPVLVEAQLQGDILGGYLSGQYALFPELWLRGGLRANAFMAVSGGEVTTRFSPRAELAWNASDRAILTLGVGRYHQFVQHRLLGDENIFFEAPEEEEFVIGSSLGVAGATHVVARLEQAFDQGVRFGLEGFYKSFETVEKLRRPQVQASGIELWLRRAGAVWESSLGYSTGWAWAVEDTALSSSIFAGRHLVDASVGARLGPANRIRMRATYATGVPYTAIPHGGDETQEPAAGLSSLRGPFGSFGEEETPPPEPGLPRGSYLRVEGEVSRTWSGGEADSPFEVTAYLRVVNGLDRRDAMFVRVDDPAVASDREQTRGLPGSVLPILGVRWNF